MTLAQSHLPAVCVVRVVCVMCVRACVRARSYAYSSGIWVPSSSLPSWSSTNLVISQRSRRFPNNRATQRAASFVPHPPTHAPPLRRLQSRPTLPHCRTRVAFSRQSAHPQTAVDTCVVDWSAHVRALTTGHATARATCMHRRTHTQRHTNTHPQRHTHTQSNIAPPTRIHTGIASHAAAQLLSYRSAAPTTSEKSFSPSPSPCMASCINCRRCSSRTAKRCNMS